MMKWFSYIILSLSLVACTEPIVVEIDSFPASTPLGEPIYLSGNFNNWNPIDPEFIVHRNSTGGGTVEIPNGLGELEFKFTRGDWTSVEVDSCGNDISNRHYSDRVNISHITIANWKDRTERFCNGIDLYIRVPAETAVPNEIYFCGDFNGWNLADPQFRAIHLGGLNYRVSLPMDAANSGYKINRGTWNTVEVSMDGDEMEDRRLSNESTQRILVHQWKDLCLQEHPYKYIEITSVPPTTPEGSELYFASNLNGWNPTHREYAFQPLPNGHYILQIENPSEEFDFKVTRGQGWPSVEVDQFGKDISDRHVPFSAQDTLKINIVGWKDFQ